MATSVHTLLVSLIFARHRATCKAIETAADSFVRIIGTIKTSVTYGNACFILEIEK